MTVKKAWYSGDMGSECEEEGMRGKMVVEVKGLRGLVVLGEEKERREAREKRMVAHGLKEALRVLREENLRLRQGKRELEAKRERQRREGQGVLIAELEGRVKGLEEELRKAEEELKGLRAFKGKAEEERKQVL